MEIRRKKKMMMMKNWVRTEGKALLRRIPIVHERIFQHQKKPKKERIARREDKHLFTQTHYKEQKSETPKMTTN